MFIEDEELRALFGAESEEHLQSLDEGLLRLERDPAQTSVLEDVFRGAHSIKGAARMLGVGEVEIVAHQIEEILGQARSGALTLTSEIIDRIYSGLDAIRQLVREAVSGETANVDIAVVLAQIEGKSPLAAAPKPGQNAGVPKAAPKNPIVESQNISVEDTNLSIELPSISVGDQKLSAEDQTLSAAPQNHSSNVPHISVEDERLPAEDQSINGDVQQLSVEEQNLSSDSAELSLAPAPVSSPVPGDSGAAASPAAFKIETMRVEPQKLDALMILAGELTVTSTRVVRGLERLGEISALWEEWHKDVVASRLALGELERRTQRITQSLPDVTQTFALAPQETSERALRKLTALHERQEQRLERLRVLLEEMQRTTVEDVTRLDFVAGDLEEGITNIRLLPLSTLFNLFPRLVRDLSRAQNKEVQLLTEGGDTFADKRVLEEMKDPLMHIIRNAIDHGIETPDERERNGKPRAASLRLKAYQTSTNIVIEIGDDGRGLNLEAIKRTALRRHVLREDELANLSTEQIQLLIFAPGFSTSPLVTDVSGRGVGLDVVRANVELLKGSIHVQSSPGIGCAFRIQLPLTLATTRTLLVQAGGRPFALPVEYVENTLLVAPREVFRMEGGDTLRLEGQPVSVAPLTSLLEMPESAKAASDKPLFCILMNVGEARFGVFVDALLDEQEVMLKPLGGLLKRVRNVSGSTILGTGEVCPVLNAPDLLKTLQKRGARSLPAPILEIEAERKKLILLAEDSITTRTQEKRILEGAGYEVVTAVDGADAFQKLPTREFDALVSDIEMPNLTGLGLAQKVRADAKYKELPIILVTSLASDDDRRRGVEVGANAYITKGAFEQKVLLDTLRRLV